jgi:hypothetical protein
MEIRAIRVSARDLAKAGAAVKIAASAAKNNAGLTALLGYAAAF